MVYDSWFMVHCVWLIISGLWHGPHVLIAQVLELRVQGVELRVWDLIYRVEG